MMMTVRTAPALTIPKWLPRRARAAFYVAPASLTRARNEKLKDLEHAMRTERREIRI